MNWYKIMFGCLCSTLLLMGCGTDTKEVQTEPEPEEWLVVSVQDCQAQEIFSVPSADGIEAKLILTGVSKAKDLQIEKLANGRYQVEMKLELGLYEGCSVSYTEENTNKSKLVTGATVKSYKGVSSYEVTAPGKPTRSYETKSVKLDSMAELEKVVIEGEIRDKGRAVPIRTVGIAIVGESGGEYLVRKVIGGK
ncbi:hypothetical protein [Risungbinella massiliensis]|uniref:hypothetical protein n=1 Tax=Risungbinella massiliensis TaxID=1329796 RepID=UPI0005CBA9E7|nr:hypothetical protein [Risungbinella massiliensis]